MSISGINSVSSVNSSSSSAVCRFVSLCVLFYGQEDEAR